ncbi:MAG TPA: divalent-cation tolerance protein CutA [Oligoflexia bacterium]|nr:divalent-cation tolerance protein CutA [Oligoflexia bacterium]
MSSFPSKELAKKVAQVCIEQNICACAQIQSPMTSLYKWDGTIEESQEYLVYFKTLSHLEKKLYECIKQHHTYDCPEIISINLSHVDANYQQWMLESCQKQTTL